VVTRALPVGGKQELCLSDTHIDASIKSKNRRKMNKRIAGYSAIRLLISLVRDAA
jgi:hypothetical protein